MTELAFGKATLALINDALHVCTLVTDDATSNLELGLIVDLDVEAARVFDVTACLILLKLPVCGVLLRLLRRLDILLAWRAKLNVVVAAGLEVESRLLLMQGGNRICKVALRVEGLTSLSEAGALAE